MPENKERLIENQQQEKRETARMIDVQEAVRAPVPREVATWMEKLEGAQTQQQTVYDDKTGKPVLQPSQPAINDTSSLPVKRSTFTKGFSKKVTEAGRWLSEFILRLIKMKDGKTVFKEEEN